MINTNTIAKKAKVIPVQQSNYVLHFITSLILQFAICKACVRAVVFLFIPENI